MSDISQIGYVERTVAILHPATKEPIGVSVTLMSPDDKRMTRVKDKITNERLSLESKGKAFKADQVKANRNLILFTAMTGWEWEGEANWDGEKPDLTPKNVNDVFDRAPWFMKQVDDAFSELESFFTEANPN